MTVDGQTKTEVKVGDLVNFTIVGVAGIENVYIESCTAFNLDDANDTDYKSLGLVASGCITNSTDDVTSFISPEWSHTSINTVTNETTNSTISVTTVDNRKSFTFKQFAFMNSRFSFITCTK